MDSQPLQHFDHSKLLPRNNADLLAEYKSFWKDKNIKGDKEVIKRKKGGFDLTKEQQEDNSNEGKARKMFAQGMSERKVYKKIKKEMGITDPKEIMRIIRSVAPVNNVTEHRMQKIRAIDD